MKKILLLPVLCLLASACTYNVFNPPKVKELDPVEMFGTRGKVLQGRLYQATCESSKWGSAQSAFNTNVKKAAKTANKKGYKYFTILDKSSKSRTRNYSYTTYQNSTATSKFSARGQDGYSVTGTLDTTYNSPVQNNVSEDLHTSQVVFVLLNENELDYWNNIYSVEKYL